MDDVEIADDEIYPSSADFVSVKGFGSDYRITSFYRTRNKNIRVICGCFKGTLKEFEEKKNKERSDFKRQQVQRRVLVDC